MKMNSIRLRVLAVASASIIATLAVAGISLVLLFEQQVLRYVKHDLNIHWTELATAFEVDERGEPGLSRTLADPRYQRPYGGAYWQISDGRRPVLKSRSLWDKELPAQPVRADGANKAFKTQGPNGSWLYVIEQDVTANGTSGPRVFRLAVALDHGQVVERRQAFSWDVTRILVPIASVLVLFAWLQIWLGLRPLKLVGEQLNAVQTGQLRRMSGDFPKEISPLIGSINRLLDRQETLVRKARDRAGALAHGLKTPLTILGGEVRRIEERGLREEAKRMQEQLSLIRNHVDREVARARTSGASVGCGASTAVDATITRLLNLMRHMPRGDQLTWSAEIPTDLGVNMDPHDFGEVVGNLLDNARKWARSGVMVRVESAGDKARIIIEDDGPGFSGLGQGAWPERGITGKSDDSSSGLGLGIVEDILAEYGTALTIHGSGGCSVAFEVSICRGVPSTTVRGALTEGQVPSMVSGAAS